eukprot:TRINITY_DN9812_c0_g1_i1.p1 TRINITY_DN9812_c0_g1~~TRINITY_DN9812_c0_g1_i1.p1  ORF type:complete len:323 (-),score=37.86 TRINITY_DN9812_c0_g1_i1:42-1010(-)
MINIVDKVIFPAPVPSYSFDHPDLLWIRRAGLSPLPVHICYPEVPLSSRGLFVYAHGNGCDLGEMIPELQFYANSLNVHVLSFEYDGYGCCGGYPSESNIDQNIQLVLGFITSELGIDYSQIYLFGRSIGTGPCIKLASQFSKIGIEIAGLILQSPYMSIRHILKKFGPFAGFGSYFIADRWPSYKNIINVTCPVIWLHGEDDELILPDHSVELHTLCQSDRKVLKILEDSSHNYFHFNDVTSALDQFLTNYPVRLYESLSSDDGHLSDTEICQVLVSEEKNRNRIVTDREAYATIMDLFSASSQIVNTSWMASKNIFSSYS